MVRLWFALILFWQDGRTLSDYNIQKAKNCLDDMMRAWDKIAPTQESTLHLVLRLRGGHCQVPCGRWSHTSAYFSVCSNLETRGSAATSKLILSNTCSGIFDDPKLVADMKEAVATIKKARLC